MAHNMLPWSLGSPPLGVNFSMVQVYKIKNVSIEKRSRNDGMES